MIRAADKWSEIEAVVNSQEAVDLVEEGFSENWHHLLQLIEKKIGEDIHSEDRERLERDLYDWWKNGNFRVWAEGEEDPFEVGKWEFGDPDFWYE